MNRRAGQQLARLELGMRPNCQWLEVTGRGKGRYTHNGKLDCAKARLTRLTDLDTYMEFTDYILHFTKTQTIHTPQWGDRGSDFTSAD